MGFEDELQRGVFCIPQCERCGRTVWPPSEFCDGCFGSTILRKGDFGGRIIEFSRHDDHYFCLVEIEGSFRIMAKKTATPRTGQYVRISRCGISDGSYFFVVS